MSIAPMKKLTLFVSGRDSDDIISELMKLRCVEITKAETDGLSLPPCEFPGKIEEYRRNILRIREAVEALSKYSIRKFALIKPKLDADREAFVGNGSYEAAWETVKNVEINLNKTAEAKALSLACEEKASSLMPWSSSPVPLSFDGTAKTVYLRGSLPLSADIQALNETLSDYYTQLYPVSDGNGVLYVETYVLRGYEEKAIRLLTAQGYVRATLPDDNTTAKALCRAVSHEKSEADRQVIELTEQLRSLALQIDKLRILCDIESTRLEVVKTHELLLKTETVEYLTGWVPTENAEKVEALLAEYSCAYDFEDPVEETDDPPVLLKNNKFASCFEWVVGMYSYPKYGTFDPTFIMSIFYCILFGMMFADAGYGLLFVLIAFVGVPLLKIKGGLKKTIQMFGYCGISCIVMGILFGGVFGDLPVRFTTGILGGSEFNLALLLDPVKDPLTFLIISLGVGALHLLTGMAIKFYLLCRDGHVFDAIIDVGLWWAIFAGLAMLVLVPSVGTWVTIIAVALKVLLGGRKEKNWLMKPVKGLLSLYDLINYASDLLSYSRILALGLASSIIAQVVNIIGTMNGNTFMGWFMLIVVGILGHLINIGLNALGAFVHTSRLQYIEFFNKFFTDGGRKFEPVKPVDEFTSIE